MEKKIISPLIMGLAIAAMLIVFAVISITVIGIDKSQNLGWIQYLIIFVGVIGSCMIYANQLDGNVSFGNVFATGFKVTTIFTCFFIIYLLLALTIIFPEIKEKTLTIMQAQMVKNKTGNGNQDEMNVIIGKIRDHFVSITAGGTAIGLVIIGTISSLVGALVAKKNANFVPFDQIGNS